MHLLSVVESCDSSITANLGLVPPPYRFGGLRNARTARMELSAGLFAYIKVRRKRVAERESGLSVPACGSKGCLMDKALQMISNMRRRRETAPRFCRPRGKVAEATRRMRPSPWRAEARFAGGQRRDAADAQHWAAEFVNRFLMDGPPPGHRALTTDSSVLTSIGNDFGYDPSSPSRCRRSGVRRRVRRHFHLGQQPTSSARCRRPASKACSPLSGLTGDGEGAWLRCATSCLRWGIVHAARAGDARHRAYALR